MSEQVVLRLAQFGLRLGKLLQHPTPGDLHPPDVPLQMIRHLDRPFGVERIHGLDDDVEAETATLEPLLKIWSVNVAVPLFDGT